MNNLYNIAGLSFTFIWNITVLFGTVWLITEKDWSPWTLVVTLFFIFSWKKEEEPKNNVEDSSKIILNEKL